MKAFHILIGVGIMSLTFLIIANFHVFNPHQKFSARHHQYTKIDTLIEIIKLQNESISFLTNYSNPNLNNIKLLDELQLKQLEIAQLQDENEKQKNILASFQNQIKSLSNSNQAPPVPIPSNIHPNIESIQIKACEPSTDDHFLLPKLPNMEADCEKRYGMELIKLWRQSEQTWCESSTSTSTTDNSKARPQATLKCFPYTQEHKRKDGRGADMFCVATDVFIDFSKVSGTHVTHGKPQRGDQYHNFKSGSIFGYCDKTPHYLSQLFMPHHRTQMNTFITKSIVKDNIDFQYITQDIPTYVLARDEDCENSFHSTADFMNMFVVLSVLKQSPKDLQVLLFDKHSDGPYIELIKKAFSPNHPVIRPASYNNKIVLFKKLIFHLESPAGLIFPKVSLPDPMRCHDTSLFNGYRRFVLDAFNLLDVPPPVIPSVLLSLRHRTTHKNVGRVLGNEKEVIALLKEGNMMDLQ
eukprot:gene9908-20605_t